MSAFSWHGFLVLLSVTSILTTGIVLLMQNAASRIHRSFFSVAITNAICLFGFGTGALVADTQMKMWCFYLSYFLGIPFLPFSIYWFGSEWSRNVEKIKVGLVFAWGVLNALLLLCFLLPTLHIVPRAWGFYPRIDVNGFFSGATIVSLVASFLSAYAVVIVKFNHRLLRVKTPVDRKELRGGRSAFVVGFMGLIDILSAVGVPVYPIGYIPSLIMISSVAYLLLRYRFMRGDLLARRFSLILSLYSFLLVFFFPAGVCVWRRSLIALPSSVLTAVGFEFLLFCGFLLTGSLAYVFLFTRAPESDQVSLGNRTRELKFSLPAVVGAIDTPNVQKVRPLKLADKNTRQVDVEKFPGFIRWEKERVGRRIETVSLGGLVLEIIHRLKPLFRQKKIKVIPHVDAGTSVCLDIEMMQQVVSSLLLNAVKYGARQITVILAEEGNWMRLTVLDNGIGIEKENLPHVFNKSVQAKDRSKGAGIGLFIAKSWVDLHGGKIWAESPGLNQGSSFHILLPR